MNRRVLRGLAALSLASACSGSGANSGPAKAAVDQTALLFGLVTGTGVPVGTQPSNSVQVFDTGGGSVTISGASIGMGPTSITQTLPLGPDGGAVSSTLAADPSHPEFFTASTPSAGSVSGTSASVIQVIFAPTIPGVFTANLNITTSTGNLTVLLGGEGVAPLVSTANGVTAYTVPNVTLMDNVGDDGGPLYYSDAGPNYATGYSSTIIQLYNTGSSTLSFNPATLDLDGGVSGPWALCERYSPSLPCYPGPTPAMVDPAYSDGGLAVIPALDGGVYVASAALKVYFLPSVPGTYSQTITVTSNATNTPSLTLTVTGTATGL